MKKKDAAEKEVKGKTDEEIYQEKQEKFTQALIICDRYKLYII